MDARKSDTGADAAPPTTPDQLLARLAALGIAADTVTHPPVFTVEESRRLRGNLPGGHCKNLFLKDKKDRLWLVTVAEDAVVDLKSLPARLGSARLSFGAADLLWRVLGVRPGAVTPFAIINDAAGAVTLVLDRSLMIHDRIHCHPLINDRTTAIAPGDLIRFARACGHEPQMVDLSPPSPA